MEEDPPPGVPEWVVTYGDMMSLLLTFFIMLVSLSEVVADQKYRAILDSLQQYIGYRLAPAGPPGKSFPLNSLIGTLESLGSHTNLDDGRGGVKRESVRGDDYQVLVTREGKPIAVGDPILFEPGSAELTTAASEQLIASSMAVAGKPNKIEIRASLPKERSGDVIDSSGRLTLAYRRSRAIQRFLLAQEAAKIDPRRFRLTVAASLESREGAAAPGAAEAERVEILMLDAFVEEFIGPRERNGSQRRPESP